jgi:ubiquinone/menaquinone biosynthesis C-methylase UbiE
MAEGTPGSAEIDRIAAAYRRRDRAPAPPAHADPAQLAHLQDLEWQLVRALGAAGVSLEGAEVLDVGSGSGFLLHRVVELGAARGTGLDLMEERVAAGRARYPQLELVQGNAAALPFGDGAFDVVTQFTCLSSVLDNGLRAAIAAEMWRVLRPGGAIVSYDMRPAWKPLGALGKRLRERGGAQGWTPVTAIGADELRRLFPGEMTLHTVSLNAALPAAVRRRRSLALALQALPVLRSHHLAVVRRPLS